LLGGSSSINPTQRYGTKGLMEGNFCRRRSWW
jgi:hypothetical protein